MCEATLPAFADLMEVGLVQSGALMVPGPWFREAAHLCRAGGFDAGVHLTLTAEWDHLRWAPLTTCDPASGLIDAEGFFPRSAAQLGNASVEAVRTELQAQIERAFAAGLAPTHLDAHMHVATLPRFLPAYVELGIVHGLPALFPPDRIATAPAQREQLRRVLGGVFVEFDTLMQMPLTGNPDDARLRAEAMFDALRPGLNGVLIHPARDTPELRAIASDWRHRVQDYEVFRSPSLLQYARERGILFIGYRPLREALRRGSTSGNHPNTAAR